MVAYISGILLSIEDLCGYTYGIDVDEFQIKTENTQLDKRCGQGKITHLEKSS